MGSNKLRHSPLSQVDVEADISSFPPPSFQAFGETRTHSAGAGNIISLIDDIVLYLDGIVRGMVNFLNVDSIEP
jgi:hypothetical protein